MIQDKIEQANYLLEYKDYLIIGLSFLSAYFFYAKNKKNDELKYIKEKLSNRKYKLYNDLYSVFFDMVKSKKSETKNKNADLELVDKLIDIKKEMFIYAPDDILKSFLSWDKDVKDKTIDDTENMMKYFHLLSLIRKDMGNKNTSVDEKDILESILISEKDISKLSK